MPTRLYMIPQGQSTCMYVFDPRRPLDVFQWLAPEGITGFEVSHVCLPGALWEPDGEGWRLDRKQEGKGSYSIIITPGEDYVQMALEVNNASGKTMRDIVSHSCCQFRFSRNLYPNAIEHAYIKTGGKYRRILETDRSQSFQGVMPVYAINGQPRSPWMRNATQDKYGWGLSRDLADNAMILLNNGNDREWIATFSTWANELMFNTKPPFHGCIHSNMFCAELPDGKTWHTRSRIYIHNGTLEDMDRKYEAAMAKLNKECSL